MRPILSALLLALPLAACQSGGAALAPPAPPPGQAPVGVTPSSFSMPTGSGCTGEVARFQAIMDNDLDTGHTTKSVHTQVSGQIAQARATCQAGNEAGATAQIRAIRARFGYPG